MDTGGGTINWALTLVLSVALGVLGNLLTTPVEKWLARQSVTQGKKRIGKLKREFRLVTELAESQRALIAWVGGILLACVGFIMALLYLSFLASLAFDMLLHRPTSGYGDSSPLFVKMFGIPENMEDFTAFLAIFFVFIAAPFLIVMYSTIRRGIIILTAVRRFEKYKAYAEKQIAELETRHGLGTPKGNIIK